MSIYFALGTLYLISGLLFHKPGFLEFAREITPPDALALILFVAFVIIVLFWPVLLINDFLPRGNDNADS